ncbi:MAG: YlxR family protein [Clostridia bacterium]|nr:YlxR family protein [Clostridia bacterium]
MGIKKIPMRQCVGCMEMKPKKELIRVVKSPEGEISLDISGKKNGRGAYICKSNDCLARAIKAKRFQRVFECVIPDSVCNSLEEELNAVDQ